jgi:hypothetical protein
MKLKEFLNENKRLKKVVQSSGYTGEVKEIKVPEDYRECSVCGEWKPKESYYGEDKDYVSRTNCKECYNLTADEFTEMPKKLKEIKNTKLKEYLENKIIKCEECGKEVKTKYSRDGFCRDCYDNQYRCQGCGCLLGDDDDYDGYCEGCH